MSSYTDSPSGATGREGAILPLLFTLHIQGVGKGKERFMKEKKKGHRKRNAFPLIPLYKEKEYKEKEKD